MVPERAAAGGARPTFRTPRVIYLGLCALLLVGILAQVFMAGLGVLVDPRYFALHQSFGHLFGPVIVLMLVYALSGRLPRQVVLATLGLLLLYGLQYVFLGLGAGLSFLRPFHVVDALLLFWSAARLAQDTRQRLTGTHLQRSLPTEGA
ncbi:DUF6220 domain-containing protein [Deinococcus sp.]|uniref:DUF6220 domain-containing protein n=1 Tax=Deinococcus sp. TaxID=47478 RepID=UPI003C7E1AE1